MGAGRWAVFVGGGQRRDWALAARGDSTAAYHVWPWPFTFAVVVNLPALIGSVPVSGGVGMLWDGWNEVAEMTQALLFVPVFWYWVGGRMEGWSWRRRGVWMQRSTGGGGRLEV